MNKRLMYGMGIAAAILALTAAGCGDDEESGGDGEPVIVTMWWHTGNPEETEATDAAVEAFNGSRTDIQIEKTDLPGGTYTDQVNAAALAGDLPCVLDFDGPFVYDFAWSGYLVPIEEYVSDELRADFLPSIIDQGTYNGQLYSLGQFDSGLGLYANKSYLDQVDARTPTFEEPWDLAEFEAVVAAMAELPEIDYPLDLKINYGASEWYTYGFSAIMRSFGGDLIDSTDFQSASGTLDSPESVAAMETVQRWFEQGWVDPATTTDDSFYGAKTAGIAYVGHWMWAAHSDALGDDLLVLPMPSFGNEPITGTGSWNYGISSDCDDPDAAWEVLEHLVSVDSILDITDRNGAVPARLSVLEQSELYQEGAPLEIFARQLAEGRGMPRPQYPGYATLTEVFAQAAADIIAGADVQTELTEAAEAIDQNIEDNGGYAVG